MNTNDKKILVLTHVDADGLAGAAVATMHIREVWGDHAVIEYWPTNYHVQEALAVRERLENVRYEEVYCVDMSFQLSIMQSIKEVGVPFFLYDHHKTAIDTYTGKEFDEMYASAHNLHIVVNKDECGASLAWKTLFPKYQMPMLLAYVRDYDLWIKQYGDNTECVNLFMKEMLHPIKLQSPVLEPVPEFNEVVNHFITYLADPAWLKHILSHGEELLEAFNAKVDEYIKSAKLASSCDIPEVPYFVLLECPRTYIAAAANSLVISTRCIVVGIPDERSSISLYGGDDADCIDVSEIARRLGGGGHKYAAGFRFSQEFLAHIQSAPAMYSFGGKGE